MGNEAWRMKDCVLCKFPFKCSRGDALYCSWGCRQRARRVRMGKLTRIQAELLAMNERAAFSRACVDAETARLNALGDKPA